MKNFTSLLMTTALFFMGTVSSQQALAIEPVDGVYQIGSKQDFKEFAEIVNHDGRAHQFHAVVTADFTVDELVMVGAPSNAFAGSFDGQGHTITVNYNQQTGGYDGECGLFRRINGCTIRNLHVTGQITTKGLCAGGMVSGIWQKALIENCVVSTTITDTQSGDGTHGGIVARVSDKNDIVIRNCVFDGSIQAPQREGSGGILGWPDNASTQVKIENCLMMGQLNLKKGSDNDLIVRNSATVTNCYYVDAQGLNNSKNAIKVLDGQMASGELCFLLNGRQSDTPAWFQTIGTDAMPSPLAEGIVYANGQLKCDGTPKEGSTVTYSNTDGAERDDHAFEHGICTVCQFVDRTYLTPATDGYYELASPTDLRWFACFINSSDNRAVNARLTADIDFTDYQLMIGDGDEDYSYQGIFDGQGHRVKVAYTVSQKNVALFRYLRAATIKNLITEGTIQNESNPCSGGIFAGSRSNTVVENCVSYIIFNRTTDGDATIGGIGAYMHDHGTIRNCAFLGTVNAPSSTGNGGLLGYANGANDVRIENCLVNASQFKFSGNSVSLVRNCSNVVNCYVASCGSATQAEALPVTASQLTSGELCFLLNGKVSGGTPWYQLIGTDATPLPIVKEGALVYAVGDAKCDGTFKGEVTFSNTESAGSKDPHTFADGICEVCGAPDTEYIQADGEGFYPLDEAKDLVWFAAIVGQVDGSVKGMLTADIDFKDVDFTGIGTPDSPYTGTFDGQNHVVSNLMLDNQATELPAGFFNNAKAGAVIKGFTIDNTCYIVGHHYVAAFVGQISGPGEITLERLGNESDVTAWNQNAGGILGCNTDGSLKVRMINCYNTGLISSNNESGGVSGWLGDNAVLTNCYNMGTVMGENSKSFARGNNITVNNCFDPVSTLTGQSLLTPIEDFTNGNVYTKLAEAAPGVWFLSAKENGYPVLRNTGITTGIESVQSARNMKSEVFDLQGRRIAPSQMKSGLYIMNGKKVVLK